MHFLNQHLNQPIAMAAQREGKQVLAHVLLGEPLDDCGDPHHGIRLIEVLIEKLLTGIGL